MTTTLYIGNRNYSSWSMRAWLVARLSGLPFTTGLVPLYTEESAARIAAVSPSGLLPCLHDGDARIWDSLAITEYLNERLPGSGIWPAAPAARALARSACAEMHGGFSALRATVPMDISRAPALAPLSPGVRGEMRRIEDLWRDCRRLAEGGPFLFGAWCAADCFFAPVVMRIRGGCIDVDEATRHYCHAVTGHADVSAWMEAALEEPWEIDWEGARQTGERPRARRRPGN